MAVVDSDEWRRRGLASAIADLGGLFALGPVLDHDQARRADEWDAHTVVVRCSPPGEERFDQFTGLGTVRAIRKATSGMDDRPPVIVLIAAERATSLVPVRAAAAGVDFLYWHREVTALDDLERLLLAPDAARSPARRVDFGALRQLGVTFSSPLDVGLHFIEQQGLVTLFTGDEIALSRRRSITVRQQLTKMMRVRSTVAAGPTTVDRTAPSWRELRRIVNTARGAAA